MRWKNARRSKNIDDRRGKGGGLAIGGGIGGIIMALIAIFLFKQDPAQVMQGGMSGQTVGDYKPTPEEEELAEFSKTVLAFTEDIWDQVYPVMARHREYDTPIKQYEHPTMVFYSGKTPTRCGTGDAAMGPFYCPGDNQVYIDLTFFKELKEKFQAPGDFAQAYVIAHEVGHHIQNLLGLSRKVQSQRGAGNYKQLQVRLELQADYLAGVWANRAQREFNILERGDIEEGLQAAFAVGDDTIQTRARGYAVPDSFTHGSAEQRIRWFRLGLETGDPLAHNPFRGAYEDL